MNSQDEAFTLSNPRLLSAGFFALLAVIITIAIDFTFDFLGIERMLPTYQAILLAVVIAAIFGALFGERIVHSPYPYKKRTFIAGFLMVILALPFYDLIFLYLFKRYHPDSFIDFRLGDFFNMYLFVLLYSFLLAGLWLAISAGLAAIYLRGQLVYDILHSKYDIAERRRTKQSLNNDTKDIKTKNDPY